MNQETSLVFMPHLPDSDQELLPITQRETVINMHQIDPGVLENQLEKLVGELLPPEDVFKDDVWKFSAFNREGSSYLNYNEANFAAHSNLGEWSVY